MRLKQRITRSAFERSSARRQKETRSILMRSAEFWFVQYCFVAKLSVGYVNTRDDHNSKRQHVYEAKAICWSKLLELKMCYLYFFCLHCLINIHIFDYPDSRLSGLFTLVPPSPDNRGSTVVVPLSSYVRVSLSLLFTYSSGIQQYSDLSCIALDYYSTVVSHSDVNKRLRNQ